MQGRQGTRDRDPFPPTPTTQVPAEQREPAAFFYIFSSGGYRLSDGLPIDDRMRLGLSMESNFGPVPGFLHYTVSGSTSPLIATSSHLP